MRKLLCISVLGFFAAQAPSLPAEPILGSIVSGSLFFGSNIGFNGFSTANGGSGTTATIGPGVEFTYADAYNTDTANFSATGLRIADVVGVNAAPFTMSFVDTAFTGFTQLTNTSGFTYSFANSTLTVNFAGTTAPGTYATTFNYATPLITPEPASFVLLATALLGLLARTMLLALAPECMHHERHART